ncbi:MAG: sulfatase [Planctomycetes bacterium]|nr:sulfatase [Planctomycetota bacterium]
MGERMTHRVFFESRSMNITAERVQGLFPRHFAWLMSLMCALLVNGCDRNGGDIRPDIVIVVMDTLRRDHMSAYGYHRDTTPFLCELSAQSRVYDQAYSVSCWTPPGHASLFTGMYPIAHGVTQEHWMLEDDARTLAEVLGENGYRTVGIAENPMLSTAFHFNQGFEAFHEIWQEAGQQQAGEQTLTRVRGILDNIPETEPLFMFVNLNTAHKPYNAAKQFTGRFTNDRSIKLESYDRKRFYLGEVTYSEEEHNHLKDLYDAEVLYVDYQIREIVGALKAGGRWDRTLLVVTADHGENFGDHGHVGHSFSLYESTIKIPLIIRYPSRFTPGSRDGDPTQIIDIFPTLVNLLGIKDISSQGTDLLQPGGRTQRPVFCEYFRPKQAFQIFGAQANDPRLQVYNRHLRSLIFRDTKLIWGEDGKHELYRLDKDPAEKENLIGTKEGDQVKEALLAIMDRTVEKFDQGRSKTPQELPEPLDEKTLEAMRTLGYIR